MSTLASMMTSLAAMAMQPAAADPASETAVPVAQRAAEGLAHATAHADAPWTAALIPGLPLLAFVLCGLFAALKVKSKLPAFATVAILAASFGVTLHLFITRYMGGHGGEHVVHLFDWIRISWGVNAGETFVAPAGFYIDSLTVLWMLFVTGLATLIALYSMEYMVHDVGPGYCRFFAAFNLFVFSMSCLVMGDNLLLLFLGWEGVGLCSYLLIGYFYKKPSAVAAAKKAFILNRIGDLGLILGIMATFVVFGTIEFKPLFAMIREGVDAAGNPLADHWATTLIPLLFTIGAFGKSAQVFFYVWLPDAMEGPTPVSALIHAATMVTAGVFLIARMYPLFAADDDKLILAVVAWSGAITALWAATIEMAIFDIKRVMGYSTISQLGYMFAGLGLLSPTGAAFHTFTHAFFKATLFLGVGAVMHGFGGQLDLRRLSGVAWMKGFGLVGLAMFIGSINLGGIPFTAGFFSKDIILAQGFTTPGTMVAGASWVAWILLLTAGMTAYYTFRTFFRVYAGPREFVPGDDAELLDLGRHPKGVSLEQWHKEHGHGHGHGHGHDHDHGHGHGSGGVAERRETTRIDFDPTTEEFDPHPPGLAMKLAIGACAVLSILAAGLYFFKGLPGGEHGGWVASMVHGSSANFASPEGTFNFMGITSPKAMYFISAAVGLVGILIAAYLHGPKGWQGLFIGNRTSPDNAPRADGLANLFGPLTRAARNKYYVDEFYDFIIRKPLKVLSHLFHLFDQFVVDGLVVVAGWLPKGLGRLVRPTQNGELHVYALGMAGGLAVIMVVVLVVLR